MIINSFFRSLYHLPLLPFLFHHLPPPFFPFSQEGEAAYDFLWKGCVVVLAIYIFFTLQMLLARLTGHTHHHQVRSRRSPILRNASHGNTVASTAIPNLKIITLFSLFFLSSPTHKGGHTHGAALGCHHVP
jgi:hypothetical protein